MYFGTLAHQLTTLIAKMKMRRVVWLLVVAVFVASLLPTIIARPVENENEGGGSQLFETPEDGELPAWFQNLIDYAASSKDNDSD
ncbi:hypothetical protein Pcinc_032980 [Petrolisthes cinctipes]|uniref:Uncharacterized protein n=1 Tax=Petrolisthes cinctipes TaxID=88211 RepID=A0AAE1ET02_PETCI|nr:hypothetical protein Pcinc_032980 [Petrolisthes cinctipes]